MIVRMFYTRLAFHRHSSCALQAAGAYREWKQRPRGSNAFLAACTSLDYTAMLKGFKSVGVSITNFSIDTYSSY
jgi:hypothetical protein